MADKDLNALFLNTDIYYAEKQISYVKGLTNTLASCRGCAMLPKVCAGTLLASAPKIFAPPLETKVGFANLLAAT